MSPFRCGENAQAASAACRRQAGQGGHGPFHLPIKLLFINLLAIFAVLSPFLSINHPGRFTAAISTNRRKNYAKLIFTS
jgi:hypothetical protein